MSTTSIAPTTNPAARAAAVSPRSQGAVRWALARVEGRRMLTHPLFVLGMALAVGLSLLSLRAAGIDSGGDRLFELAGGCFSAFGAIWMFLVTCLAASRERRDGAEDLYAAARVTAALRTQAAIMSLAWAGLAASVLIAAMTVLVAGVDGVVTIEGEPYALRPLELAQGPLYLMMVGAFGILVGSWARRTYPAALGALVLFLPPAVWLPWIVFGEVAPQVGPTDWLDDASLGWHLPGLAGLAALAIAGALARHDRRPRVALLALAGLAAAVAGVVLGTPTGPAPSP